MTNLSLLYILEIKIIIKKNTVYRSVQYVYTQGIYKRITRKKQVQKTNEFEVHNFQSAKIYISMRFNMHHQSFVKYHGQLSYRRILKIPFRT